MLRQSLTHGSHTLKPGGGWLPESWMAGAQIRKAMRAAAGATRTVR
jgi:hypothetical protein